ncbi:inverse autotransporter beta domain-containing protein [Blochmannia endosymbiont of Polyrhachis (Hedomyrma) turneri]|uniref:inverse autotransporter beta domain-containing protein n=1 Tax=Blochmannia endosymbiont of Polyrhachis (Hedomyrma) turneri TaxID=1505596 RepID=UPI00061AC4BC|nr:inverse autotransporter beta-barrel domain-containing protein [Blochmannia endosymbiont of Polyrhachis (Hedomyrma) turneri]
MLSQCNRYYCYKNKIINIYENNQHKKKYPQHTNQNYKKYYKYLKKNNYNNDLTQNNHIIHSYIPERFLSEIHINHNSINLLNTYFKNYKKLMFNQISLNNSHEKKIYNFGVGYRKNYRKDLIIGNNIFYDTIISENKKNFLSIGHELFKKQTHITTNIYYNMFSKSYLTIRNKIHYPHSYDIRIKSALPFFKATMGKISMERSFNHNNNHNVQKKLMIKQNKSNYKITLGIDYTPIPMFTFSIDKTIYNQKKIHGTKFNITVNYRLITLSNKIISYNQDINNNKKEALIDKNYTVNRNNNILTDYYNNDNNSNIMRHSIHIIQNNSDEIPLLLKNIFHENNITNTTQYVEQNKYEILKLEKNNSNTQLKKNYHPNNNDLKLFAVITTYNIKQKEHLNDDYLTSIMKPVNSKIKNLQQIHIMNKNSDPSLIDNKDNIINQEKKEKSSENNTHDSNTNIIINHECSNKSNKIITKKDSKTKIQEKNTHYHNYQTQIIPPPPPFPNTYSTTQDKINVTIQQPSNQYTSNDDNCDNYHDNQMSKELIQNINQCKQKQFSSLGSEQHLAKLNSITKKRKKTTSTNSTNSNNSEITTILKIIERQNILTSDSDNTDNDDKISINSNNNEFSDN